MQDLVAGQIDMMCAEGSQTLPYLRGGMMKGFAVMAKARWSAAPDIPTMDEVGVPGMHISFWHGLWTPKGTSKKIITKLNAAIAGSLSDPTVIKQLTKMGLVLATREQQTPAALAAFHKAETEKWWPIIKAADIKTQ
jgi:tripartite-type tricarboxylate transporter receptor subunit TctC